MWNCVLNKHFNHAVLSKLANTAALFPFLVKASFPLKPTRDTLGQASGQ
jgi:hypothetical protein